MAVIDPALKLDGVREVVHRRVGPRDVAERGHGVVLARVLLEDAQRLRVRFERSLQVASGPIEHRQVVQVQGDIRMIRTERLASERQRAEIVLLRFRVVSPLARRDAEILQRDRDA